MPSILRMFGRRPATQTTQLAASLRSLHNAPSAPQDTLGRTPPMRELSLAHNAHTAGVRIPNLAPSISRSPTPNPDDRTEGLHARLVDRGDLHFRSIREALLADAQLGSNHPSVEDAAVRYVKAHAEHHNISSILTQARQLGAKTVLRALGSQGWKSQSLMDSRIDTTFYDYDEWDGSYNASMRGVAQVPGGVVAISNQAYGGIKFFSKDNNWRETTVRFSLSDVDAVLQNPSAISAFGDRLLMGDENGALCVVSPSQAGNLWNVEMVAGPQRDGIHWSSIRPIGHDAFVAASRDKTLSVWQRTGNHWTREDLKIGRGESFVAASSLGFAVFTKGDKAPAAYMRVNGKWKGESLRAHRDAVTAMTSLPDGRLITASTDHEVRIWNHETGRWTSQPLSNLPFMPTGVTALGDGFIVNGKQQAIVFRQINRSWDSYPLDMRDGLGQDGAITNICPTERGFVAVNNDEANSKVRRYDFDMPYTLDPASIQGVDFDAAISATRLDLAARLFRNGARPTEAQLKLAATSPTAALAQLAYEPGIDLRNAHGQTLVGIALQNSPAKAAAHIARGATVDAADIEEFNKRAGERGMLPVFVSLVARGIVDIKALPSNLERMSEGGMTLVSTLCLYGMTSEATEMCRRDPTLPIFPNIAFEVPSSDALRAVGRAMAALPAALVKTALDSAGESLRAELLPQALTSRSPALVEACVTAYAATKSQASEGLRVAINDLAKDPRDGRPLLASLFRHGSVHFWSAPVWEAVDYGDAALEVLRAAGMPGAVLARCECARPPAEWLMPRWCEIQALLPGAKQAWLANAIPERAGRAVAFTAERKKLVTPTALRDPQAWQMLWSVKFNQEKGLDNTGLTKEWITLRMAEIFTPSGSLFTNAVGNAALLSFRPEFAGDNLDPSVREELITAGRLYARAIKERVPAGVSLPLSLLAQLTGSEFTMAQLKELNVGYANSLDFILNKAQNDADLENALPGQAFTFFDHKGEELSMHPGGEDEPLTFANRKRYVDEALAFYLGRQFNAAQEAFCQGVNDVIPAALLHQLTPSDVASMVLGETKVDYDEWHANWQLQVGESTEDVVTPNNVAQYLRNAQQLPEPQRKTAEATVKVARLFWSAAKALGPSEHMKIIETATGLRRVPPGGMRRLPTTFTLKVKMQKDGSVRGTTCFNRLDLPFVDTEEEMKIVLLGAGSGDGNRANESFAVE